MDSRLGGGGIGGVWGTTERRGRSTPYVSQSTPASRCSTLAPSYGIEQEAEVVAGEALRNRSAGEVMITTKVELADDDPRRSDRSDDQEPGGEPGAVMDRPATSAVSGWFRGCLAKPANTSRRTADTKYRWVPRPHGRSSCPFGGL
jgi:hypothetical protein